MTSSRLATALAGGALALTLVLSGCGGGADDGAANGSAASDVAAPARGEHVDADTFRAGIQADNVTVIDVRTPQEFAAGHIEGALNINVESPDFAAQIADLDPEGTYAVYCRSGNRSRVAVQQMERAGLTNVFGLDGGIGALRKSDLVTG